MNNILEVFNFAKQETPLPIEKIEKSLNKFIAWGKDNLYPNFILKLANESAIHKGILSSKASYVFGDGLSDKSGNIIKDLINVNPVDSLNDFTRKALNDYLLFNGFACEITFNLLGEPIGYYHIPFQNVRPNKNKSKFWVSDDWYNNRSNLLSYDRYIVGGENADNTSKIFYYTSYSPSVNNVYPTQDYSGAIDSIFVDILISDMMKNNIANNFSLAKIVSTYGGGASEEQKKQATKNFKEKFTGNGDNFILETLSATDKPTTVTTIPSDDYADKLVEVIKKIERNILSAHSGTSSLLFGIEKEGSLGNATELENAYQIFKDVFVKDKRLELQSGLNKLFSESNNIPYIQFKDKAKLFIPVLDSTLKSQIMTINEIREEQGLPKIDDGDKFIPTQNKNEFTLKTPTENFSSCNHDHNFNEDYYLANEEDWELIKDFGVMSEEFEIVEDDGDDTKQEFTTKNIEVWYKYSLRDGIEGDPILPTTRYFCRKALESGKLFARTDIQKMSRALGYDVFKYCGGWYSNPKTGEKTPYCRHYWKPVKVIRTGNKI